MNDLMGKQIGNYNIIESIGDGGMGKVFKGIHVTLDRIVALKMIDPELLSNSEIINRFYKEAKIQALLNHPNIVTVFDFLEVENNYFIVMEYIKGESIGKIIKDQGAFEFNVAINIFKQILSGIAHAHSKGIIHRDIKPNNFLLTPNVVKITDFGIAHIISDTGLTVAGAVLGTPKYMSPEQILGQKIDHRSDVYSLGISFYEMLTGKVPFDGSGNSDYEIKRGHVEGEPPLLRTINPGISDETEKIVLKSLSKSPDQRYQSVVEFLEAFEQIKTYDLRVNSDEDLNSSDQLIVNIGEDNINEDSNDSAGYDDSGDLCDLSLPFILSTFYKEKKSGILNIESDYNMKVYFIQGYIVYLEGNNKEYALAEILVDKSRISKEDQESAVSFAHETGLKIGEALIKMGKISPHELSDLLETQIKEKLLAGLVISTGKYYYIDTQDLNLEVMYNINPIQVIYDAVKRSILEDRNITDLISDDTTSITPSPNITNELSNLKLARPKELKLANLLRKDQAISDLIDKSPLSEEETYDFLYFLKIADFIDLKSENFNNPKDVSNDEKQKHLDEKKSSDDDTDRMSIDEIEEIRNLTERNNK